jgi:plastocyanin
MLDNRGFALERGRRVRPLTLLVVLLVASACATTTGAPDPTTTLPPPTPTARTTPAVVPSVAVPTSTIQSGLVTVQMAEHFYSPSLVTISVGTTVVWVVVGQQTHDVHARDGSFNSPPMGPGNSFKVTFLKPGTFAYFCAPHEGDGMFGEVDVVAN